MRSLLNLQDKLLAPIGNGDNLLPLAARFVFAATLAVYFFKSGLTKLGDGLHLEPMRRFFRVRWRMRAMT